jgi:hypothetical protein
MLLEQSILVYPIPADTQLEIAKRFWNSTSFRPGNLGSYFQYYTDQCQIVYQSQKEAFPLKKHSDVVAIASDITSGLPRSKVKESLATRYAVIGCLTDEALDACIDLTVRLVFMFHVGEFRSTFTRCRSPAWTTGSLCDFMRTEFPSKPLIIHHGVKLHRGFDVCNMVRIAGFKIRLTTNLFQHLHLRDDRTVTIFHHASFLKSQRQYVYPVAIPSVATHKITW